MTSYDDNIARASNDDTDNTEKRQALAAELEAWLNQNRTKLNDADAYREHFKLAFESWGIEKETLAAVLFISPDIVDSWLRDIVPPEYAREMVMDTIIDLLKRPQRNAPLRPLLQQGPEV